MTIRPLHELKGHKAPVLTLDYSDKTFLGDSTLASGSGFFYGLYVLNLFTKQTLYLIYEQRIRRVVYGILEQIK